ncbi:hypothetical protein CHUAL_009197 [Chamberlinius hualienensis]
MQCFLIFDHLNDVIYVKQDERFYHYIRKKCIKDGLLQEEDVFCRPGSMDYHNALVQLYSPMVASQRIMVNQFNSPYSGITCQDGTIVTFVEYLSFILVGIGRGDNLTESFLRKKLQISRRLRSSTQEFIEKRELLGKLIDCWDVLYKNELSFRLEAHERVLTNSDLCSNWVKLLQNVLEKVRHRARETSVCHAFILISTKVLALYSSRNVSSISDGDLLLLILLSSVHHSEVSTVNEPDCFDPQLESLHSSDSDQYFSPCSSPAPSASTSGVLSSISADLSREILNIKIEEGSEEISEQNGEVDYADGYVDISSDFKSNLVFLQSGYGSLVPYVINFVHITEGVVLVTVSVVNKHILSSSLMSVDSMDGNMKHIIDGLKKIKASGGIELFIKRIQKGWEMAKKCGFADYLKIRDQNRIPAKLERSFTQLSICMKKCFIKYCFVWNSREMSVSGSLIDAQALVRFTLADYIEYLKVKSEQNVSMANYYADFAGMIHFIFIDRSNNQIIVPSLDNHEQSNTSHNTRGQNSIHKKLCYMMDKAWAHLIQGLTTLIWRDDCYHYSYFLWFEDVVGNPCKPVFPCVALEWKMEPGVISKHYYKHLIQNCFPSTQDYVRCYELYCLHLAAVPPSVINQHARTLTAKVWELSGASQSPVDLLL